MGGKEGKRDLSLMRVPFTLVILKCCGERKNLEDCRLPKLRIDEPGELPHKLRVEPVGVIDPLTELSRLMARMSLDEEGARTR